MHLRLSEDVAERNSILLRGVGSFSEALEAVKLGQRLCRSGWNGKGMFIFMLIHHAWRIDEDAEEYFGLNPDGRASNRSTFIAMKTASGDVVPWMPSQADLFMNDWGFYVT